MCWLKFPFIKEEEPCHEHGKIIQKIEIYKSEDETKKRVSLIKEMDEEEFINLLKGKTIYEIDRKGK